MTDDPRSAVAPLVHDHNRPPVLEWRGLIIDMAVLRLFFAFLISALVVIACAWIILAPTNQATTEASIAILSATVTGWVTYMARS